MTHGRQGIFKMPMTHDSATFMVYLLKIVIVLILLIIIGSLGSGLFFLLKDKERSPRAIKALTLRIGLSLALFVLLLIAFERGWIQPHGLRLNSNPPPGATTSAEGNLP
jgi:hypothetical protein